jgi:hypothetical protein
MSESGCATCTWRAKYDRQPKSFLGRIWRWHVNFCPGWKSYLKSLPDEEKRVVIERYSLDGTKFE